MVSGTHALLKQVVLEVEGEAGQRLEGSDDQCFHTYGEFSLPPPSPPPPPPLSFHPKIQVLRPKSQFRGPNVSLEVQISAQRPNS